MKNLYAFAVVGLLAISGATLGSENSAFAKTKSVTIVTENGPVRGISQAGEKQFLGIPYAAPPVDTLRWMPPKPLGKWHGLLDASRFGSICPQVFADPNKVFGNEDCLFLNIYTPNGGTSDQGKSEDDEDSLPVMVWIHGGGYSSGSGSDYDPSPLVDRGGVIVVTINYRLNVLGFFAQSALDAEGHPSANYGLMDQQFALGWVRRNIKAFGGDPNRVTIFGHSAGGQSVYLHLVSPTSGGLFQRAIAQTGGIGASFAPYLAMQTLQDSEQDGAAFAASVGCADQSAQCLRAKDASVLVEALPFAGHPVVDGQVIPQAPGVAFPAGQFHHIPVISGSSHDEYRLNYVNEEFFGPGPATDAAYPDKVAEFLGVPNPDPSGLLQYFLDNYPLTDYPPPPGVMSAPLALGAIGTDGLSACTARIADEGLSQFTPTYAYEFADENAPFPSALPFAYFQAPENFVVPPLSFPPGAYHGSELFYLFDFGANLNSDQRHLADTMIRYWTEFARTGDPNSVGAPQWPLYSATNEQFQSLRPPTPAVKLDFATDHKCAVWGL
jgi:para-nitrobenzyl esterase